MQLLADFFNCKKPDVEFDKKWGLEADIEISDAHHLALVTVFSWEDFDYDAVVRDLLEQMDADSVDYQVVQRDARIRAPRPGPNAPWVHIERPA